ncbi:hypothetical protein HY251_14365 [bacterium]|nr:hypothetical protein [bacterium]
MSSRVGRWLLLAALALPGFLSLPHARAQDDMLPPEDPAADWSFLFQRGLDLLRDGKDKGPAGTRDIELSIAAFSSCCTLFPDRPVAYYNVACGYALLKKPKKACDWLKKSFDRGFLDLAHVSRDTDLDPIREDERFKTLVDDTRKNVLANRPQALRVSPKNARGAGGDGVPPRQKEGEKLPLLVFLHGDRSSLPELKKKLAPIADEVGCVLLLPSGRTVDNTGNAHWDTTAETCVVADIEAALADEDLGVDPKRVILAGELDGATHAFTFAQEHAWKRVVAVAGVQDQVEPAKAKDMRVYMITPSAFEALAAATRTARDELMAAGASVAIERHGERAPFPKDGLEALVRATRWTLGQSVSIPGDGSVKKY